MMGMSGGFRVEVDGNQVHLHRQTNRIRATRPLRIECTWSSDLGTFPTQHHLETNPLVFKPSDWVELHEGEGDLVATEELKLSVDGKEVHNFGSVRNHHLIHGWTVELTRSSPPEITLSIEGEDEQMNPLEAYRRTSAISNRTPKGLKQTIHAMLPGLCRFERRDASTDEVTVRLAKSPCGRFWDDCTLSFAPSAQHTTWVKSELRSTFVNSLKAFTVHKDSIHLQFEAGDDKIIPIKHKLDTPEQLDAIVPSLNEELHTLALPTGVNPAGEEHVTIEFTTPTRDAHRFVFKKTEHSRNNLHFSEVTAELEVAKPVVVSIHNIEVKMHDANPQQSLCTLVMTADLRNKFTGVVLQSRKAPLNNVHLYAYHQRDLRNLIPFFGEEGDRQAYYLRITQENFHHVPIDLGPLLADRFEIPLENRIFHLCPFTLGVTIPGTNTHLGTLPADLITKTSVTWNHVERIQWLNLWGTGWKQVLTTAGFNPRKYCEFFEKQLRDGFIAEKSDLLAFSDALRNAVTNNGITSEMFTQLLNAAKHRVQQLEGTPEWD
jgi:hypothetical protein